MATSNPSISAKVALLRRPRINNLVAMKMHLPLVLTISFVAVAALCSGRSHATDPTPALTCEAAENRQLDFWLGDWDVYDMPGNGAPAAHASITSLLDRCVIHELYEGTNGGRGESFSIYDRPRGVWHQTWVTNHGKLLMIEGRLGNGKVVLSGQQLTDEHKRHDVRASWWPEKDGVRELGESSDDGGKTWNTDFDLIFKHHR